MPVNRIAGTFIFSHIEVHANPTPSRATASEVVIARKVVDELILKLDSGARSGSSPR